MSRAWFLFTVIFIFSVPGLLHAQEVNGRIYSSATDSLLRGVSVRNKSNNRLAISDQSGKFRILVTEGDSLVFSSSGYEPDTIVVEWFMTAGTFDVTLDVAVMMLPAVKVNSNYRDDSLSQRNDYQHIFKKQPGITGFNTPEKGTGIVLSPLSYMSKKAKYQRKLKKRLLREEEEDYVDRVFAIPWIARLTNLTGDSLILFMYSYRPSASFCRKTDHPGMIIYVNDSLKEFRKPKKKGE